MEIPVLVSSATIPALFLGNLNDPWVVRLVATLPTDVFCLDCPSDLPEQIPDRILPRLVILQRAYLTDPDAVRLRKLRNQFPQARFLLIVSPLVRYQQLMGWVPFVEAILSEATAGEVLARHFEEVQPIASAVREVWILSTNHDLGCWLADLAQAAGFSSRFVRGVSGRTIPSGSLVVWDVPSLEPDWSTRLQRLADGRTVLALLSFADRELVQHAQAAGAAACLELPCDPEDLVFVLNRLARPSRAAEGPFRSGRTSGRMSSKGASAYDSGVQQRPVSNPQGSH